MSQRVLGGVAVLLVVAIYASNFVATRYTLLHGLTTFDLTALRYAVAGGVLLPYFFRLGLADLGGMGWRKAIVVTCLAGAPYMLIFYYGLTLAPAAHGAVLNPGVVPSVVFVGLVFLGRQRFSIVRAMALGLIVVGLVLVTGASFSSQRPVLVGDLLLFITGISWGLFTLLARLWDLQPLSATTVICVLSLLYLPAYLMAGHDGLSASWRHIVAQAVFQGLVISIGSLYLVTYAVRHLGAQLTSLFSPIVPILTTLLALRFLGERPTPLQWTGVFVVVAGMLISAAGAASTAR